MNGYVCMLVHCSVQISVYEERANKSIIYHSQSNIEGMIVDTAYDLKFVHQIARLLV